MLDKYCFEPEREVDLDTSTSSEAEETLDNDSQERLGNIIWYVTISVVTKFRGVCMSETSLPIRCMCGHCQPMPTARECVCCQEIDKIKVLLVGDPTPVCITQHPEFSSACLCRTVLTIAYHSHQHRYGTSSMPTDENR